MGDRLKDKVAVVTGGGRGIGKGISLLLAEEGASIVVNDLGCDIDGSGSSNIPADNTVSEIQSKGGNAIANYNNVAKMDGAENTIKSAIDNFGRVDILITSTVTLRDRMIFQMSPEDWDNVITNNLKAAFTISKFAAIVFRQQRSGKIVNLTSDAGLGDMGRSNYAASSEGLAGLTRTLARDLGKYGVTANGISAMAQTRSFPGTTDEFKIAEGPYPTPDERAGIGPSPVIDEWEGPGHPDDPENIAPLAVYLTTNASPNVNGYIFGIRRGSIFLYSNPKAEKSVYKRGKFTMDEMDVLFPKIIGSGY